MWGCRQQWLCCSHYVLQRLKQQYKSYGTLTTSPYKTCQTRFIILYSKLLPLHMPPHPPFRLTSYAVHVPTFPALHQLIYGDIKHEPKKNYKFAKFMDPKTSYNLENTHTTHTHTHTHTKQNHKLTYTHVYMKTKTLQNVMYHLP